jgi:hypothetical protein
MRVCERSGGRRLILIPPWFLPKPVKRQVEAFLPRYYHKRFRLYFDRYGCVRCSRKRVLYAGSGLCVSCIGLISDRLKRLDAKLKSTIAVNPRMGNQAFLRRRRTARELLADFRDAGLGRASRRDRRGPKCETRTESGG